MRKKNSHRTEDQEKGKTKTRVEPIRIKARELGPRSLSAKVNLDDPTALCRVSGKWVHRSDRMMDLGPYVYVTALIGFTSLYTSVAGARCARTHKGDHVCPHALEGPRWKVEGGMQELAVNGARIRGYNDRTCKCDPVESNCG